MNCFRKPAWRPERIICGMDDKCDIYCKIPSIDADADGDAFVECKTAKRLRSIIPCIVYIEIVIDVVYGSIDVFHWKRS